MHREPSEGKRILVISDMGINEANVYKTDKGFVLRTPSGIPIIRELVRCWTPLYTFPPGYLAEDKDLFELLEEAKGGNDEES